MKTTLSFVGDIFPGNLPYTIGFGVQSEFEKHLGENWSKALSDLFNASDLVFGNFEAPLIEDTILRNFKPFCGHPEFVKLLKESGFKVVNIANNHMLQYGEKNFDSTIGIINDTEIKVIGNLIEGKPNIEVLEVNGLKIAMVGFNDIHDHVNNGKYAELSLEIIDQTITSIHADIKIVSLHWGSEYMSVPSREQIEIAHKIIESGANLIIGHHPHVIQPVEKYKNGLICYSLGNFIFDMHWSKSTREGLIVDVIVDVKKPTEFDFKIRKIWIQKSYLPKVVKTHKTFLLDSQCFNNTRNVNEGALKYHKKARAIRNWHRLISKIYWLMNFHRQPVKVSSSIFKSFFKFR
ncbi:MAG: CapA family protein [Bacteroidales bacterium]|nr:CapA family protein [Bacteroidales bacterium]